MGFGAVFGSAVVLQVFGGGGPLGDGDDVVVVAFMGGGGADRGGAGAVPEVDGVAQFSGRESAELFHVEEVAVVVGHQSVEQGAGLSGEVADDVGLDEGGAVGELSWSVAEPEQRLRGDDHADGGGDGPVVVVVRAGGDHRPARAVGVGCRLGRRGVGGRFRRAGQVRVGRWRVRVGAERGCREVPVVVGVSGPVGGVDASDGAGGRAHLRVVCPVGHWFRCGCTGVDRFGAVEFGADRFGAVGLVGVLDRLGGGRDVLVPALAGFFRLVFVFIGVVLPVDVAAVADLAEQEFGAGVGAALLEGAGVTGFGDGGQGVEDLVDRVGVGGGDGGAEEADAVDVGADGDVPVLQRSAHPVVGLVGFDLGDEFVQPATQQLHGFVGGNVDDQGVQQLF